MFGLIKEEKIAKNNLSNFIDYLDQKYNEYHALTQQAYNKYGSFKNPYTPGTPKFYQAISDINFDCMVKDKITQEISMLYTSIKKLYNCAHSHNLVEDTFKRKIEFSDDYRYRAACMATLKQIKSRCLHFQESYGKHYRMANENMHQKFKTYIVAMNEIENSKKCIDEYNNVYCDINTSIVANLFPKVMNLGNEVYSNTKNLIEEMRANNENDWAVFIERMEKFIPTFAVWDKKYDIEREKDVNMRMEYVKFFNDLYNQAEKMIGVSSFCFKDDNDKINMNGIMNIVLALPEK